MHERRQRADRFAAAFCLCEDREDAIEGSYRSIDKSHAKRRVRAEYGSSPQLWAIVWVLRAL